MAANPAPAKGGESDHRQSRSPDLIANKPARVFARQRKFKARQGIIARNNHNDADEEKADRHRTEGGLEAITHHVGKESEKLHAGEEGRRARERKENAHCTNDGRNPGHQSNRTPHLSRPVLFDHRALLHANETHQNAERQKEPHRFELCKVLLVKACSGHRAPRFHPNGSQPFETDKALQNAYEAGYKRHRHQAQGQINERTTIGVKDLTGYEIPEPRASEQQQLFALHAWNHSQERVALIKPGRGDCGIYRFQFFRHHEGRKVGRKLKNA